MAADYAFCARLTGPPLQNARWLSPAPSQNLRGTFANISLSADPAISRGLMKGKANTRGLVFGSGRASLLEAWLLHLEFVSWDFKKNYHSSQCQQGCASGWGEASPLEARKVNVRSTGPHSELNQDQTEILRYPSPAGAPGSRGW